MAISVDAILQRMITDACNMNPNLVGKITQGTETYIRFATAASAIWGAYKQLDWTLDQIFPSTMSKESLEKFATERGKDPDGLTGAELLSFVLSYLRKPPSGGKTSDYERWALETVSAGSVVPITPSMVSGAALQVDADAFCNPKDKESVAFSANSASNSKYVKVDFGEPKRISGVGLGFTTSRGARIRVLSSADDIVYAVQGTFDASGWSVLNFSGAETFRYWSFSIETIDPLESWQNPSLHDVKCFGAEFYTDDDMQEKATFAKAVKNAYGVGTVGILLAPVTLSMKMLEAVRIHCEDEGPVAPKEIFVSVQRETPVNVKVVLTLSGAFNNETFQSDVEKYFAELKAGDMIVTAQFVVFAIKNGATNATVLTSVNGAAYTDAATIEASADQKFTLGTLSVE